MPRLAERLLLACFAIFTAPDIYAGDYPFFASDDTLELVIEAPMRTLLRQAEKNPELNGRLTYTDSEGADVTIDITITTRGHSRLELCSFPPLSISLNKDQTDGTLFAGQRRLKIVSPCKTGSKYQRYFYQEYSIYRAYNVVSDHSFRVRMLNITFRDEDQKRKDDVVAAFFIEADREVAERLNMATVKTKKISPKQFDVAEINKFELFQYMIGNTDWAILKGPGEEDCCHNGKVIGFPGSGENLLVLPYDFDQAGIINTDYALPAKGFPIRSVKQRLYRGRCKHNEQLDKTIALLNEKRSEIEAALAPRELSERNKKSALNYLDAFFVTINDPKELGKDLIEKCRGAH